MEDNKIKRNFILGEEWIYYKLYLGVKTADRVLEEAIKPCVEYLLKKNKIDCWFFIRYADPDLHLRIRLHSTSTKNIGFIIQKFYKSIEKFVDHELIWKTQADTYQREIERYGMHTIELSERLFFIDSEIQLKILPLVKNPDGETQRWMMALKLTDYLLDCFKYDMSKKLSLLATLKEGFGKEFGINRFLKGQLDEKFQKERRLIEKSLNSDTEFESIIASFLDLAKMYKVNLNLLATDIIQKNDNAIKGIHLNDLVSSYIHMIMNRMFTSEQRMHELVLYDFLFRYYRSSIARFKEC